MAVRVALVTGAGSGVGQAAALALLREGFRVFLVGRREAALESTRSQAGDRAEHAFAISADVTDPSSVDGVFSEVRSRAGRLDLLFNNAGTSAPSVPFDELTYDQWTKVVSVNLTGAFLVAQAAFRFMKEQRPQGGRIINNGSISAHAPRPNSAPYTATKHAITGLTRSLSLDGRAHDIACGQIDIGNAETQMASATAKGAAQANGTIMPEPMFDPCHVGDTIVHMARLPLEANVQFITVMATKMPFIGRG
ncbi:SDR family oxidoreductase [Labrys wisconsinensis]|uniref:NAD(P)-dependent dehydrogenase (Short-subunit alcohol dehydrogenase family) n=1 Tax=Labrys wisconsinensis TaxID=425677 RepID=A0ABU0JAT8_9HYPH|nr:SDR family oxidoreductase [Labrys wisconsinensis]MDQ0471387.1 NAD(P)-dependent dehydrogenase (short-subunit alcohol dehydrogenase family) [Labrys wisconsinensis]